MTNKEAPDTSYPPWKRHLYKIIFEADTPAGKLFDVALLILIVFSVVIICAETMPVFQTVDSDGVTQSHRFFIVAEWIVTILFTIEYFCRIACVRRNIFSAFSELLTCYRSFRPTCPPCWVEPVPRLW